MDFSLISLDVDGTLGNPIVLGAAIICALLVAVTLVLLMKATQRRSWWKAASAATAGILLDRYSREITRIVATIIYGLSGHWGVGFFHSTPVWFSPVLGVAFAGAFLAGRALRRRGGTPSVTV
jgi:hypothetical protein